MKTTTVNLDQTSHGPTCVHCEILVVLRRARTEGKIATPLDALTILGEVVGDHLTTAPNQDLVMRGFFTCGSAIVGTLIANGQEDAGRSVARVMGGQVLIKDERPPASRH